MHALDCVKELRVNFHITRAGGGLAVEARPVPETPAYLRKWMGETKEIATAGRLLE